MSIKYRLILSYIGMIVIPIVLITLINFAFSFFLFDERESLMDKYNPAMKFMHYMRKNNEMNRKMNLVTLDNEESLINNSYIQSVEDEMKEFYGGIIIRENDEIVYASETLKGLVDEITLPLFGEEEYGKEKLRIHDRYFIGSQFDYYLKEDKISIFLVTNYYEMRKDVGSGATILTISIICILILTTLVLTYSIYKDITKSLGKLRHAANEMKSGNLDYKIEKHLNDEIGDLSLAFEEMRLKLKHSLEVQRKYEENRKTLISNISHDLKTPLMSIKGHIEGIKDGIAHSPEKMDKYINTIHEKSKDMELLINELFLFSRLDLEKEEFNFQTVDIIEFLRFSIEDLSFDLEKIGGKITLNNEEESLYIKADLQKLKRVILNIVGNSIKYRRKEPLTIDIDVKKLENEVVVGIKDNGKGISQENLSLIFDRFYRADKSRNTSIVGSGLGLAISKQIIEKHGGKIWAKSKENQGTSVFFSLKEWKEGEIIHEEDINY